MNEVTLSRIRQEAYEQGYSDGKVDGYNLAGTRMSLAKQERKKGKWIQNDNGTYSCSLCQSWIPEEQHYYARFCLYCGERMEE